MRAVVVTGASSGIGEACALRLAELGFRVFAGVRKEEDGEALRSKASERLVPLLLDVTDAGSIASAARKVAESVGERGLGGLVNNAGIAVAGPLEFLPVEELRRQLEVNVVGQIAVTQAFLPMLRTGRGRMVNIGSVSGRVAAPLLGPYCASKFALEALTATLRMELQPWGIAVSLIEPAGIATPIWEKSLARGDKLIAALPPEVQERYGKMIAAQRKRAIKTGKHGIPISEVVGPVIHALMSKRPRARYPIGSITRLGEVLRLLPDRVRERIILRQLSR
ncbi:MAG TPA: SDR family NAD(P)-dependent oxidoreductase [Chloroflexia bacterium]|nr:SDR family NAD(P)-dependent oxidoreductase [Chloroflexia bacterium]